MSNSNWIWGTYTSDSESSPVINVEGFILDTNEMFDDEDKERKWFDKNYKVSYGSSSWCDPLIHYKGKCQVRLSVVRKEFEKRMTDARVKKADEIVACPECLKKQGLVEPGCKKCFGVGYVKKVK
jgi:hypothetical protein